MYPHNPLSRAGWQAGYVPYSYQWGRYLTYLPSGRATLSTADSPSSHRFSGTWLTDTPERPQTVEQIIAHGYLAVPHTDPVMAILSDKHNTARLGLDDVISQVRGRYELYRLTIYDLDTAICEAHNAVFRQEAAQGHPADSRQRYSAEKRTQEIYMEKRAARLDLWRDVSRLRLLLPENAEHYLTAYRKVSVLRDQGDAS